MKHGNMVIEYADGTSRSFGDGDGPRYVLVFNDPAVGRDMLLHPELRFGELYMEGRWWLREGSLAGLLTMLFQNMDTGTVPLWRQMLHQGMRRIRQRNHARAARRNVHHHYDVGNDIYALFLDEDWQYSCGYFPNPETTLEEAQVAKKRHIAAKMLLEDDQRVLDIGCGWGGMGLYLAKHTGVNVTGVTLSDEQLARARRRARDTAGVEFRLQDYRDVTESFDRIVSVGMFEHVGVGYFRQYFETVKRLLTDDGVMMLHSIGRTGPPGYTAPFIDKHIFPGGYIPSLSEVLPIIESVGLYVTDIEIWRLHYAETLKAWGERFAANRSKVIALKDERFYRMWDFYLAASEASFRSGDMMVFQIQLAKQQSTVPLTRDYIAEAEHGLAARDGRQLMGPALVAQRR
ncbi:cyclopropane-fatty-acyl-phospholipid synthase family protein [Acuticoccus sp. MNP-M23]|uniref:cyclopropane-fatty-acyl-phospholipid synthase family protein n=1 Tax=Acuticoccus sp. MNP-M23 TaxID=3072793 RepID=UPI0028163848|nr:cyclopropane-fatty-acyl-phospholipid synthase family protein [Acuticoccus sp. MNP-M23]WMS41269.1 cyclopropane-fatty-acyl-phospholipid synthase family protein [Acuticoccus sp. MNP-M23]